MALTDGDLARELALGEAPSDAEFDELLDARYRDASEIFWTPVAVARLAARWLEQSHVRDVIDVGSGVGKFCIVAALCARDLRTVGIEQRAPLVAAARRLSARFDLRRRALFAHATAQHAQLARFQAMYLFNPFGESALPVEARLDDSVDLSAQRARCDVRVVERALDDMPVGGVLLTYHGFGGRVPDTFVLVRNEPIETNALRMWTKRDARPRGAVWVEVGSDVVLCDRNFLEARP